MLRVGYTENIVEKPKQLGRCLISMDPLCRVADEGGGHG